MKCVICHSEEIELMKVREEIPMNNDIVYVPIKVLVCKNCGERYYDRRTMQFLKEVQEKLQKRKASLREIGKVLMYVT